MYHEYRLYLLRITLYHVRITMYHNVSCMYHTDLLVSHAHILTRAYMRQYSYLSNDTLVSRRIMLYHVRISCITLPMFVSHCITCITSVSRCITLYHMYHARTSHVPHISTHRVTVRFTDVPDADGKKKKKGTPILDGPASLIYPVRSCLPLMLTQNTPSPSPVPNDSIHDDTT